MVTSLKNTAKIYLDGKWVSPRNAHVSLFDHGLLYGDGVFEGIRAYDGRVFRLPYLWPFEGTGKARIACMAHAEQLIDGRVDGQSVADL